MFFSRTSRENSLSAIEGTESAVESGFQRDAVPATVSVDHMQSGGIGYRYVIGRNADNLSCETTKNYQLDQWAVVKIHTILSVRFVHVAIYMSSHRDQTKPSMREFGQEGSRVSSNSMRVSNERDEMGERYK